MPTVAFLTVCTLQRKTGLAEPVVHKALVSAWKEANAWLVGEYVIMPDHMHLFCGPQREDVSIECWLYLSCLGGEEFDGSTQSRPTDAQISGPGVSPSHIANVLTPVLPGRSNIPPRHYANGCS